MPRDGPARAVAGGAGHLFRRQAPVSGDNGRGLYGLTASIQSRLLPQSVRACAGCT